MSFPDVPTYDWSDHCRILLQGMRRDLSFVSHDQINNIPGVMAHAAKAVAEIEWILARIPEPPKPKPPKPKPGRPVRLKVTSHTLPQLPPHQPFILQ